MNQRNNLHIRLTNEEKKKIEENSIKFGFHTMSEYVRFIALNVKNITIKIK
jgi:hypothetical protein